MAELVDVDDRPQAASLGPWPSPSGPPVAAQLPDLVPMPHPSFEQPVPAPVSAPRYVVSTGPAAILAPDPALAPVHGTSPSIPPAAAPAARPLGYADVAGFDPAATPAGGTRRPRRRGRRLVSGVLVLGLLGGAATAAYVYGPDLYDRYTSDQAVDEPAAPLSFPRATAPTPAIRTATFVVDGLGPDDGAAAGVPSDSSYTVTIDFDTTVSRIVIDRTDLPDLEVLTLFDDAVIRRVDQSVWFQVPRGDLPIHRTAERATWVRTLDELFPPAVRDQITITDATQSDVAGLPTRRLAVTFDPRLLEAGALGDPMVQPPINDLATVVDPSSAPTGPAETGTPPATAAGAAPAAPAAPMVELEVWIDDQGVVRQTTGPLQHGASRLTVLEISGEAWLPAFPEPGQIQPLTAAALIQLGL